MRSLRGVSAGLIGTPERSGSFMGTLQGFKRCVLWGLGGGLGGPLDTWIRGCLKCASVCFTTWDSITPLKLTRNPRDQFEMPLNSLGTL